MSWEESYNKVLQEAASSNDKKMYIEETKDVVKAIFTAWDRAKGMGISPDEFAKDIEKLVEGALQDIH